MKNGARNTNAINPTGNTRTSISRSFFKEVFSRTSHTPTTTILRHSIKGAIIRTTAGPSEGPPSTALNDALKQQEPPPPSAKIAALRRLQRAPLTPFVQKAPSLGRPHGNAGPLAATTKHAAGSFCRLLICGSSQREAELNPPVNLAVFLFFYEHFLSSRI